VVPAATARLRRETGVTGRTAKQFGPNRATDRARPCFGTAAADERGPSSCCAPRRSATIVLLLGARSKSETGRKKRFNAKKKTVTKTPPKLSGVLEAVGLYTYR